MAKKSAKKKANKVVNALFGKQEEKPVAKKRATRRVPTPTISTNEKETPSESNSEGIKIMQVINGVSIPQYPLELATKALGDKTPAVVAWYAKNHPEAHAKLYANKRLG